MAVGRTNAGKRNGGGGGSVVVWDEPDAAGGVIRHIEADSAYGLEDGSGTPSTSQQEISPASGKYFRKFTIGAMPAGTEGTPSATKGQVSNHAVQITPSVTNAAGYINGGTINGTPVTVTASELISFSTIHRGSSAPSSSLGVDGDVYIQTSWGS